MTFRLSRKFLRPNFRTNGSQNEREYCSPLEVLKILDLSITHIMIMIYSRPGSEHNITRLLAGRISSCGQLLEQALPSRPDGEAESKPRTIWELQMK